MGTLNRKKSVDLRERNIWKALITFALPIFIGQIFQNLYSSVDSIVVVRFVSSDALGAVNASASISGMLVVFFTGLSADVGVNGVAIETVISQGISLILVICKPLY